MLHRTTIWKMLFFPVVLVLSFFVQQTFAAGEPSKREIEARERAERRTLTAEEIRVAKLEQAGRYQHVYGRETRTSAVVYTRRPGSRIPAVGTVSDTLATPALTNLNYVSVRLDTILHTFNGDMIFRLTGPNGLVSSFCVRRGGGNDNFIGTAFTDFAYRPISSAATVDTPYTGFWKPDSNLSRFQGASMPAGNWILTVVDTAAGDSGTIVQWSLVVEPNELVPPNIVHTRLADTSLTTNRVAMATITDTSGVAGGANAPRLMWKLSTSGTYTAAAVDSLSGNNRYFAIPGQAVGSIVQYYIAAQDNAPTNNSGTLPFGGSGTPPGTTAPPTVFQYKVGNTLAAGTYTVGTGGFFPTIDSAFARVSGGIKGAITLNLIDTLYAAPDRPRIGGSRFAPDVVYEGGIQEKRRVDSEADTINQATLVGPIFGASASSRITLRPLTARRVVILGRGASTIRLLNASWVTIDGITNTPAATTSLTIGNGASGGVGILLEGDCDNNIITRVQFRLPQASGSAAIFLTNSAANGTPDNNVIGGTSLTTGNIIHSATDGILLIGNATAGPTGNIIRFNQMGSATDSLGELGVYNQQAYQTQINNNIIQNVRALAGFNSAGIWVATKHLNTRIWNNVIKNVKVGSGQTAALFAAGIYSFGTATDITSADYYNNAIYDLDNLSSSATATVRGIYASSGQQDSITFNSVSLSGTATTAKQSAALWSATHVGQVWRNNIALNNRTETGTGFGLAFYKASTTSTLTSNRNDLYVPTQALSFIGRVGTTNYATLADWRTQTYDSNSVSWNQAFRAGTDLRIDTLVATPVNNIGQPIAGITADIDNQVRSLTTPDPGVDEFNAPPFATHDIGVATLARTAANDQPATVGTEVDAADGSSTGISEIATDGHPVTFFSSSDADTARFRAIVQNYGSFPETTYQVRWSADGVVQSTLSNTRILQPAALDTFTFQWNSTPVGAHVVRAWTLLGTDANRANDTSTVNFTITGGGAQPGDTLYSFRVPNQIILGVNKMGPSNKLVFSSGGQSSAVTTDNKWIVTTMNGALLDTTHLQINNTTGQGFGFRDLAWDGRWILASDNNQVRRIDTTTFTELVPAITGPGTLQRGLAWETTNRIWKSNFTTDPVVKFDTTGATVKTLGVPTVAPYGIAFDKWTSPNKGYLWYAQPSLAGQFRLSKIDTATGAILQTFDYSAMFPATGSSGGLDIINNHPAYPGRVVAFMVIQNFPNSICVVINLGPDSAVTPPTPGWTVRTSGTTAVLQSVKQVNANVIWAAGNGAVVRRSTDGGATWTNGNSTPGVITGDIYNIEALDANTALVTTSPAATFIYRTTNGGTTWTQVFTQTGGFINAIRMFSATNGIAEGDPVGTTFTIVTTTDGGVTWVRNATANEPVPVGTETGLNNSLSTVGTTHIWFGTSVGPVWRSTNSGTSWTRIATTFTGNNLEVHFNNTLNGVTGNNAGVANRSTDGGATWVATTIAGTGGVNGLSGSGSDFFASKGTNVYRSTDRGVTWAVSFTGAIGTLSHLDFYGSGGNLYGTTVSQTGGIATAFFVATGVKEQTQTLPTVFSLEQNYPNPFNPSTTIRYALPEAARVNLSIYNMLGQRVAELTNEVEGAGFYNAVWNGRNQTGSQVATGVYFYRIEATPVNGGAPFISLKKALLLK